MGSHVAMAHYLDPITGEKHNEHILLDRQLKDRLPDHPVAIGFELNDEHKKLHADGYIALVAIDRAKSLGTRPQDVYRLGIHMHVRREALKHILNINDADLALPLIWVDVEVIDTIKAMAGIEKEDASAEETE